MKIVKITFNHEKIVNIYIAYDVNSTFNYNENITLENCLFGAVIITKNSNISKYTYAGCSSGFDGKETFSHPCGGFGNNAIIFGIDTVLLYMLYTVVCTRFFCNGANSYLFVYGTEIYKLKAENSEIVANPLCVGNISEDFSKDNMKKIGLIRSDYDFSVDCNDIAVNDILDIHNYLMKKNDII